MSYDSLCCFRNSSEEKYRILCEIISACNQKCNFCHFHGKDKMSIENVRVILDNLRDLPIKDIILTGGEPLLHNDLFKIMDEIKQQGYNVDICTNGSLINSKNVKKLSNYLSEISISLDTSDPRMYELIRGANHYERVINSITILVNAGVEVHLTCVINKHNINEIEELIRVASLSGVNSINFLGLMTGIANDKVSANNILINSVEETLIIEQIHNYRKKYAININTKRIVSKEEKNGCRAGENILGITCAGQLVSCIMHDRSRSIDIINTSTSIRDVKEILSCVGNVCVQQ